MGVATSTGRAARMGALVGTSALILAGCASSGSGDAAGTTADVAPSTTQVQLVTLSSAAETIYGTSDSVWNSIAEDCQAELVEAFDGPEQYKAVLNELMPVTIVEVNDDANTVTYNSADGVSRTDSFVAQDDDWKITCDGSTGEDAVAASSRSADPVVESESNAVSFTCGDHNLYQPGTAIYADGSTGYEQSCANPGQNERATLNPGNQTGLPPHTYIGDDGLQHWDGTGSREEWGMQPSDNPDGTWGRVGAERCGTACGDSPTSGEIQTRHGCEDGYIEGPLCDQFN